MKIKLGRRPKTKSPKELEENKITTKEIKLDQKKRPKTKPKKELEENKTTT